MTLDEIKERVESVYRVSETFPTQGEAHKEADQFYRDLLIAIAQTEGPWQERVKLAISIEEIDFPRWYE